MSRPHREKYFPRPCTVCGIPKGADDFSIEKDTSGSRFSRRMARCRPCNVARMRTWAQRNGKQYSRNTARSRQKVNDSVIEGAVKHRQPWTGSEIETAIRTDIPMVEIARMLGRTVYAVNCIRAKVKKDPRKARLAGLDTPEARLADPGNMNIAFTRDPLGE